MIERLYIKEVTKYLEYEDYRSVYRWCKNNGVGILSDAGSKRKYVLMSEFEAAINSEAIKYIKEKYGESKLSEIIGFTMNLFSQNRNNRAEKNKKYIPVGEYEKDFLNRLQNF